MSQGRGNVPDYHLPDEILSVIPTDPYDQLDLARKITSMAIASRVSKLEAETDRLKQNVYEKDQLIYELEGKASNLDKALQEANSRLKIVVDENLKLAKERDSMSATVKKLSRELSKLETFKRQLMQSLSEDTSSQTETVNIVTCDQSAPKAYSGDDTSSIVKHRSFNGSTEGYMAKDGKPARKFSTTPYHITPRLTPTETPKIVSASGSPRAYSAAGSPHKTSGATTPTKSLYDGRGSLSSWFPSSRQSSTANSPPRERPLPELITPIPKSQLLPCINLSSCGWRREGRKDAASYYRVYVCRDMLFGPLICTSCLLLSCYYTGFHIIHYLSLCPLLYVLGRTPRIDGKEFFRLARSRLSYEQFSAFLANIKELNAQKQSREETLKKAEEIFGADNKDLYLSFQGLLSRNAH